MQMLSQPLMTAEGFINPACMNELSSAISNMGTTHERLADDPEWNTKLWVFRKEIVGYLAAWAIRQSPCGVPEGLETVCKYLDACLKKSVEWIHEGMADLTLCEISRLLHDILMDKGIEAFDNWNRSQADREGVHKDPEIAFSCRYSKDDAFYDFIDLGALLHNVCISIRDEWRANQAFDAKFEAKYGKLGADDL